MHGMLIVAVDDVETIAGIEVEIGVKLWGRSEWVHICPMQLLLLPRM